MALVHGINHLNQWNPSILKQTNQERTPNARHPQPRSFIPRRAASPPRRVHVEGVQLPRAGHRRQHGAAVAAPAEGAVHVEPAWIKTPRTRTPPLPQKKRRIMYAPCPPPRCPPPKKNKGSRPWWLPPPNRNGLIKS